MKVNNVSGRDHVVTRGHVTASAFDLDAACF